MKKVLLAAILIALVTCGLIFTGLMPQKQVEQRQQPTQPQLPSEENATILGENETGKESLTQVNVTTREENFTEGIGGEEIGSGITSKGGVEVTRVISLKIFDICSGRLEDIFSVAEGVRVCANREPPYHLNFTVNETNLTMVLEEDPGFRESYNFTNDTLVLFIFVGDIASVSKEVKHFYLETEASESFYLGDYDLHTIMENVGGELEVTKMVAALSLYLKYPAVSLNSTEIKFFLETPERSYYLGSLWARIRVE